MKKELVSKNFVIVSVVFITTLLISNLIAGKVIQIFGIVLPAAVILFPITYIFGDILTEVFGFKNARMVIWLGFACNLLAVVVYMATVALPYPQFWTAQDAYKTVLSTTPRILIASLIGYLVGSFSNSIVLSKLKIATKGKWLWTRTISSTIVGEALDTILFITITFFGTMDFSVLLQMMLFQYLWKVCYEVILTPVTYAVVKRLKKLEETDVFDVGVKYRPFGNA